MISSATPLKNVWRYLYSVAIFLLDKDLPDKFRAGLFFCVKRKGAFQKVTMLLCFQGIKMRPYLYKIRAHM